MVEDGINLRYYVALLLKRWYWIVLGGLLAALAAFVITSLQPTTYQATAAVAVARSRTDVTFDERIQTLDDDQLGNARLAADRLSALVALADSNEVVQQVLAEVGDRLSPAARRVNAVRGMVDSRLTGDLIEFTVRHEDPEVAAALVNSWAQAYARHVNRLYGNSGDDVELIATQVVAARQDYEATQEALQEFLADRQVLELTRTLESELAAKQALLEAYQESQVALEAGDAEKLDQIERWLADAETLRAQVGDSSGSFASNLGDVLALVMLRAQVYGGEEPANLQIDLATGEIAPVRPADVDNLIDVLETRRVVTEERIAASAAGAAASSDGNPLAARIAALTDEIVDLETRLEAETSAREAQRQELEAARDRAWQAYQSLSDQQLELEIRVQSGSTEVRVADLAVVPESPVGSGDLLNTLLAGIVGAMIAVGIVFLLEWWFMEEELRPQDVEETQDHSDHVPAVTEQGSSVRDRQRRVVDTGL